MIEILFSCDAVPPSMVLIFDRIIPPERESAWLSQSRLRPVLSAAGRQGLRALPPDVITYIDRLKKEWGP
jgi:membrane protein required for colicin V production